MENEDRAAGNPGEPRAFYNVSSGVNPRLFSDAIHNMLPYHMTGYPLTCTSNYTSSPVHPGLSAQTVSLALNMPAHSSSLHAQSSAGLHSAVQALAPSGGVGMLHASTAGLSQIVMPLHTQVSVGGSFHIEAPIGAQSQTTHSMWTQGTNSQALPDIVQANQQQQQQQNFQRLKVEDALSYLDQVKYQFSGQPHVYNDFLDIMKEFKSQSIDTPGVITRVSNLFRGHPDLIVGFNTFLPPGYKIEVQANETISVHQPGQQAMSLTAFQGAAAAAALQSSLRPAHLNSASASTRPDILTPPTQPVQSSGLSGSNGSNVAGAAAAVAAAPGSTAGQPVEFNHAIQYVNKIKQSYHNQPEIYKSFLEILHLYQKEQKVLKEGNGFPPGYRPLSEIEVYSKVTELFKDQPQLLAEFSQFLPDAGSGSGLMSGFGASAESSIARMRADQLDSASTKSSSATVGMSMRSSSQNLRRTSSASGTGYQPPAKKSKSGIRETSEVDRMSRLRDSSTLDKRRRDFVGDRDGDDASDILTKDVSSSHHIQRSTEHHRMRLFDPVLLSDKYRSDYEYEGRIRPFEERMSSSARKASFVVDLSSCKAEGASYRQLPKSYVHSACSGRTELCNEVLNDTYMLFPTDPTTLSQDDDEDRVDKIDKVASVAGNRKNQYEEHLFQCEDERYELDMILDVNNMAKSTFNGINNRIKGMSQDEATKFRLDEKLGSNSEVLMHIAISRLYGENTRDIINGLRVNPVTAVPVVLKRLISKEKEWRDAQKEFNRVWREQNERFYLKSLDHQATKFKQSDVKRIRSKSLLREIEVIAEEGKKGESKCSEGDKKALSLTLHDTKIRTDATSLVAHHIRRQAGLQPEDRTRMHHILRAIFPRLLHFEPPANVDLTDTLDTKDNIDASIVLPDDTNASLDAKNGSKKLSWVKIEPVGADANEDGTVASSEDKPEILFFCNDHWYLCLRLFVLLCERLQCFRRVSEQLAEEELHFGPLRSSLVQQALNLRNPNAMDMRESYGYLMDSVRSVLDGSTEASVFEEQLREVFGCHAYVAYTLDKLVQNVTRQLQHIVSKDICWQMVDTFESMDKLGLSKSAEYQKKVEEINTDDNCFKILTNAKQNFITIELIESVTSSSSDDVADRSPERDESVDEPTTQKPSYLARNLRNVMDSKRRQQPKESTGHRLTWTTNEGQEEVCLPTELQLINSTPTGGIVKYTCGALKRARQTHPQVTRHMSNKFSRWHKERWQSANVTQVQENAFGDWLLGRVDGLKQGLSTVPRPMAALEDRPPYREYIKYTVTATSEK